MFDPTDRLLKAINNQTNGKFDKFLLMADGGGKTLVTGACSPDDMAYMLYEAGKKSPTIHMAMFAALMMLEKGE